MVKIALAQMEVIPNKPRKNLDTMLQFISDAKAQDVDLVVFPELCVSGYLLGDKWLEQRYVENLMVFNEELKQASEGIAIAYGNIFVDSKFGHPNKDGRVRKYNALYVYQNGELVRRVKDVALLPKGVQPKTLLPNYRFFDDERYFFSLQDVAKDYAVELSSLLQPFELEFDGEKVPIGFEICEDLWYEDYKANGKGINVSKHLVENGAKYIINLSASPWTYGKNAARDRRIMKVKEDLGEDFVPFFYVNNVGAQNNGKNFITFDGGSTVYNKEGKPIRFAKQAYSSELLIVEETNLNSKEIQRKETSRIGEKYLAILEGISHIKNIFGTLEQPKYVIGLSGGIDSAVVVSLLERAIGSDKILAINMPTKYNSSKTKGAAAQLAKELNVEYEIIPIQELVDVNEKLLNNMLKGGKLSSLNEENIQAKIRGTSIQSNVASKYGAIFTNNGNKVETALGYATLYGDVGGAYSPIGDLTKREVYELARYMNEEIYGREVIPNSLIPDELYRFEKDQILPSAELKDDQVDPIKIGYHCLLLEAMTDFNKVGIEDIMTSYLAGTMQKDYGISNELMHRWGVDDPRTFVEDLEWFDTTIQRNVFKRIQSPPIIITSKSAYGFDIRESMLPYEKSAEYARLRKQILGD